MIKADFVTVLHEQEGVLLRDAAVGIEAVLAVIKEALQEGETVQITNFGTFKVRAKSERVGRHPATGHWLMITPRKIVTFRPSRLFRAMVDQGAIPERPRRGLGVCTSPDSTAFAPVCWAVAQWLAIAHPGR